jgi:hypothetical protein
VSQRIVAAAFAPPPRRCAAIQHAVAGLASAIPISMCSRADRRLVPHHPCRRPPRVEYVGPPRSCAARRAALRPELPARSAALWLEWNRRPQQARACASSPSAGAILNDDFAYFTHATLDFASSTKNDLRSSRSAISRPLRGREPEPDDARERPRRASQRQVVGSSQGSRAGPMNPGTWHSDRATPRGSCRYVSRVSPGRCG